MSYWIISFVSGFLTVLAPCSLFLLPTILVGSTSGKNNARPWIVVAALGASVFLFSLIIKGTSLSLAIPDIVWSYASGILLLLFGLSLLFPHGWEIISSILKFTKSQTLLNWSNKKRGTWGAVLLGASLGPIFSTCSPTFAVLLAVILPADFIQGMLNVTIFVLGMMIPFLLIGIGGQRMIKRIRFMADPNGWFRKMLGLILIFVGIMVITGFQKTIEKSLIERGYLGFVKLEQNLLEQRNQKKEEAIDSRTRDELKKFREFKTDLSLHSIPLDQILSGGPGKDGIPALTNPDFVSIEEARLPKDSLGIFVNISGDERYYPFSIMVWHEIVNDAVGGSPIAVTFCPLCGSAIVFDREVDGKILDFGVSGFLYESNLLMVDRETESLWSQVRGEAVVGFHTGTALKRIEMQRIPFSELKEKHPDSKVLSTNTGYQKDYTQNPYGDYDGTETLYFPVSIQNKQFFSKEIMLIVPIEKTWVAFPWEVLREREKAEMEVNGKTLTVNLEGSEASIDYEGQSLLGYFEMWFSFATHHASDALIWTPF